MALGGSRLDRNRFTLIGHEGFRYWNPVNPTVLDSWADALPLDSSHTVLDVGCGRGELLVRLASQHAVHAVGFDTNPLALALARELAIEQGVEDRVSLREAPFSVSALEGRRFDLVVCVGSIHAVGSFADALGTLAGVLRPGGRLLVAEGYWKQPPHPEYLAALEANPDDQLTHEGNMELARAHGLEVMAEYRTDLASWDRYEDGYAGNVMEFIETHPDDPDVDAMRERIVPWRRAYLRWGRDTLGFAMYLLATAS